MKAFGSSESLEAEAASRPRPSVLESPLEIKPVRAAKAAEALGLETVGDLIEHFPFRHEERREARPIASLGPEEDVTVIGEVRSISSRRARGRLTIQTAKIVDETGPDEGGLVQPAVARRPAPGGHPGRAARPLPGAQPRADRLGVRARRRTGGHTTGVVPVYPATEQLKSTKIRELVWNQRGRRSSTSSSRCPPGCGWPSGCPIAPPRSTRSTSRTTRTRSPRRGAGSRSRSCSCSSCRWRRASGRARASCARPPWRARASWWTRGSPRCRSR